MRIFITGINGQVGSHLAEFLLNKGLQVSGLVRRNSYPENQTTRIEHIRNRLDLHYGDITDLSSLLTVVDTVKPDIIFHTAAQSHVAVSFQEPLHTSEVTGLGTLNLLECVRKINKDIRVLNYASSEMFGNCVDNDGFQRETTSMEPVSPYGCAKLFSYQICRHYRRAYNMFIANAITFNTESPTRGSNFVTRKVVKGAVNIKKGLQEVIKLGTLNVFRDWLHVGDAINAHWLISNLNQPDDFVVASGETHSLTDLCEVVFSYLGLDYKNYIQTDPKYVRPEELFYLRGDASKLSQYGWKPSKTFKEILEEMVDYELSQDPNSVLLL